MNPSLEQAQAEARDAITAFNDHVAGCRRCDEPPGLLLCPVGERLNDEASTRAALKLFVEISHMQEAS